MLEQPVTVSGGGFLFGVDKIANTFVFTGNADLTAPLTFGTLRFTNVYRGTAFRTLTTAIRDDQSASLSVEAPASHGVTTLLRSAWILSQDSRSLGLSSLARLSGAAGVRVQPVGWWMMEAIGGVESTTQLGIQATGPLAAIRSTVNNVPLELWEANGSLLADWHHLDDQRTNSDLNVRADFLRNLIEGSHLRIGGGYGSLARQYFTSIQGGTTPDEVESRNEDRLSFDADVLYNPTPELGFALIGLVQSNNVGRSYSNGVSGVPLTAVERVSSEVLVDLEGRVIVTGARSSATLGAALFQRNETNVASPLHAIEDEDLASVRTQEYQRDNQTARSRWFARGFWSPSGVDTLSAEWNWWLLQYDTPSSLNEDDRDELNAIATIRWARRISDIVTVGAALSGQFVHLVFLKASRSALNNQNNVIRFSPFVRITGSVVTMQPHLEVLANYTVYDYEGEGASVRSYGFRQVSYRDSIRVNLTSHLRLEAPLLFRYYERSTLLWEDFAEIPQLGNLEYLARFLIFSRPNAAWDVGAGVRLYTLEQRTLEAVPGLPSVISAVRSWAPEVAIRYIGVGGSTLTLTGWYEFQTLTPENTRELPNLLMQARVAW